MKKNNVMKRTWGAIATVMLAFLFVFLSMPMKADASGDGFYINNGKLYDANGNVFVMRGINMAHTWYKDNTTESLAGIAATGSNTVRVVLSNGEVYQRDSLSDVLSIIEQCKSNKMIAVLEVHDATGGDSTSTLDKAVDYWISIKNALVGNEKYVILNIANEWYGTWNSAGWKAGNVSAIQRLRNAGIKNTIMVDCAGWGQYPQSVIDYGVDVFNADILRNTMFSVHMYEYAGGDESTVKNNINAIVNQGLALVIGEFASYHTNGDVDEQTIMNHCQSTGAGYLGWSWKGNNSDLSYLDISNDFAGQSLTSWGNTLVNGTNGIKSTSQICTVFTGSSGGGGSEGGGSEGGGSESDSGYIEYFYGSGSASSWGQAVTIGTTRAGGPIQASDLNKSNGYFYVEYTGGDRCIELCLQSWSGGGSWVKVNPTETGYTSSGYYAKFSYSAITSAYGDLSLLDQIHIGATSNPITVQKVQYAWY